MEKNGGAKETKFLTSSLESLMLELKWHLPTLRKIEKTSPFSWPDQTFAIENISYLLLQNLCQSSRQASKFTKKVNTNSLACKKQNFAVLLQRQFLASQKSLLLQRPTKSGGTIKNETTWYQIRCGMGFTCLVVTCSACSRLQHNERMEK